MRNINELPECPVATTISLVGNIYYIYKSCISLQA